MRISLLLAVFLTVSTGSIAFAEQVLPKPSEDTCSALEYKNRLGRKADAVDVDGDRMSQPFSIIRGNSDDVFDKKRNDIIYFIVDKNDVVRKITCKL